MPKRKFTEAEIIAAIHQVDAGRACIEMAREVGVLKHTGYVFAGSKTHLLTAITLDAAPPFYRLGGPRLIGPVPRHDLSKFLRKGFGQSGFNVPTGGDEAVKIILDLAEEVPYNVQMLAHGRWEQLRASKTPKEGNEHSAAWSWKSRSSASCANTIRFIRSSGTA